LVKKVPEPIPVRFRGRDRGSRVCRYLGLVRGTAVIPLWRSGRAPVFSITTADGKLDIFLPASTPYGKVALYHNLGNGKFEDVTRAAKLTPSSKVSAVPSGITTMTEPATLCSDALHRLVLLHNQKNGTFKDVTATSGLLSAGNNLGVTFVDYDHDGDLDLYVTRLTSAAGGRYRGQESPELRPAADLERDVAEQRKPHLYRCDRRLGAGRKVGWRCRRWQ
jgi:hypothetical protein